MHKFKIKQVSPLHAEVWMDGEKIKGVRAVDHRMAVDEIQTITLTLFAESVEVEPLCSPS